MTLSQITLTFGGNSLINGADFAISPMERVALVGRNGSGKSTLLKIMAGTVQPDDGTVFVKPGTRIGYLEQSPDFGGFQSLADFVTADMEPGSAYLGEITMEGLKVPAEADPSTASGGEKRRAALAKVLAGQPDLLLLDEPTNHLDIVAIDWLEAHLQQGRTAIVLISHDRSFLRALTRRTAWLDRGRIRALDRGFADFEDWRDKLLEEEEADLHRLDRKIRREEHWITHGVSGRRKRNMRRVAQLDELRRERREHVKYHGRADMHLGTEREGSKRVIEARDVSLTLGNKKLLEKFSLRVMRGDRVALIGPNGAGKTTLLNVLTKRQAPDNGYVHLAKTAEIAQLDQGRVLPPEKTLWEVMTDDADLGIRGSQDQIMVRGSPRHVIGYLKEFLFDERQARGPVSALSGGERARLLLAKLMARSCNLLVLDEPTNDLDLETLDLLQEQLDLFDGTLLLVSHDRDFIDRIATTTIAMDDLSGPVVYAGGYQDYLAQRPLPEARESTPKKHARTPPARPKHGPKRQPVSKISFTEQHRLAELPTEIDRLQFEITRLEEFLSKPDLYSREPHKFSKAAEALSERQQQLAAFENEWLALEERREQIEAQAPEAAESSPGRDPES